jgi:tetratricopeptide (TPR) repeat protein
VRSLLRSLFVLTSLLALASPSVAQPAPDLERAKASFKAGANAYAAGDYLAAIQALEAAYEISPLPAIAFSLAQAERKQYFVKEERVHLERALALFRRYLQEETRGARREDARLAISQLEPLLGPKPGSPEPIAKPQARPTRLMIVSDAPGARIALDGGAPTASPLLREVTPGKHHARVQARGFIDAERDVTALAGELLATEVRLSERPGTLHVWAPVEADVYVDGVYVGAGGPLVTVPLAAGNHQLSVAKKGQRLARRDVRLERGQAHTEVVSLEPTTQRTLSQVLFVGGGVAVGASLVLSALAIRSENRAENFLRLTSTLHKNAQPAQLTAYNASLVERDRFRTAAGVAVAGSLGMFITAVFLHELDQPRSPAASQPDERRRHAEAALAPRLSFVSGAPAADVGATVRVNF